MLSLGSLGGGVRYAFTTRAGGVSAPPFDALNLSPDVGDDPASVAANRRLVLDRLGLDGAVWLTAQHSADVAVIGEPAVGGLAVGEPDVGEPDVDGSDVDGSDVDGSDVDGSDVVAPKVDAMVSAQAGVPLAALSADCALVALADPAGVVGVAHCGRPGLTAGVVANAVAAMRELGAASIRAALGPSICPACYEVPQSMADDVWAAVPATRARNRDGGPAIDIAAGVAAQLAEAGVEIVRRVGGCTREDPTLFSYRRDGVTGRIGALVWRSA